MFSDEIFNFPGAAGNWQAFMARLFSPNITMNFAGDAAIEREVNENVASYGRQIGWLDEIVTALAKAAPEVIAKDASARDAFEKLKGAQEKIGAIKKRRKGDAYDNARDALRRLGKADPDAYGRLVRSLDPDRPPGDT